MKRRDTRSMLIDAIFSIRAWAVTIAMIVGLAGLDTPTAAVASPSYQPIIPNCSGPLVGNNGSSATCPWVGVQCRGDESFDDGVAIDAAVQTIRDKSAYAGNSWPIGFVGTLFLTGDKCIVKHSLNFTSVANVTGQPHTALLGSGFNVQAWGTQVICEVNGAVCFDATGMGHASINGLNIYGSCVVGQIPTIGFAIARPTPSLSVGAGFNYFEHPTITGCFTTTAFYTRSSETTAVFHGEFYNFQAGTDATHVTYAIDDDGLNHTNFQSTFTGTFYQAGVYSSNNDFQCYGCYFEVFGAAFTQPAIISGAVSHNFVRSYFYSPNSTAGPGLTIFTNHNAPNNDLNIDGHFEDVSLGSAILFSGDATPLIRGLHVHDDHPQQSGPFFARDVGVTLVTLEDFDARLGSLAGNNSPTWWDAGSGFAVSGYVYSHDSSFALPGSFNGLACTPNCISYSGFNGVINVSGVNTAAISNDGSITSITAVTPGGIPANWSTAKLGGSMPTVVITPATVGGGAIYQLSTIVALSTPNFTGGLGCHVGDTYSLVDNQAGGGLTSGGTMQLPITAVNPDGSVQTTGWSSTSGSAFIFNKPLSSSLTLVPVGTPFCTTPPTLALNGTTGYTTGSWSIANQGGTHATFLRVQQGAGYVGTPAITFSPNFTGAGVGAPVTVGVTGSINISATTITINGGIVEPSLPTSAGTGGLYECVDSVGVKYKKASCP